MSETNTTFLTTDWPVFGMAKGEKEKSFLIELDQLTQHHLSACTPYKNVLDKLGIETTNIGKTEDIPFLPVRLFKKQRLLSVDGADIVKTMTSSGTSGHSPSQIFLDKLTAGLQVKILARIMADFIGPKRLPMLVIDCKATVSDRYRFSARTAGILGFSMFGRDVTYALDDDMSLNVGRVREFLEKHQDSDVLLFGFTFVIWENFIRKLETLEEKLSLERGVLIHGGGWKKLQDQAVENIEFRNRTGAVTGIKRVHNYYGMVEQTGSIFMECDQGHLHASSWSDIIIRDPISFKPLPYGEVGLIQLLSTIPHSYPGHSLLSEDIGRILGEDDCPCQRKGVYFEVHGRLEQAEIRGCSDTYS